MSTVLLATHKIFWGFVFLFIDVTFLTPKFSLIWVVLGAIVLDFVTGVIKSVYKKVARTSEGYRKTAVKFSQYIIPIGALFCAQWVAHKFAPDKELTIKQINGFIMYFILYIEGTSILENCYEISPNTPIAKYIYKPLLKILKFGIENNPAVKAADKIKENENEK